MADLFTVQGAGPGDQSPLADRMRPRILDDVVGQDHIVGPGRLLRRAIQADRLSSVIFYGPPGTGKTSLARVIANTTRSTFESLNAVLAGIKDIREAIDRSDERRRLYGKRTILFVDEVHRWNKAQQDALLPWVENGTVILIGATTENPFFEVNRALVSRSRIFQLKPLSPENLRETADKALADRERGYGKWRVSFEEGALEHLVEVAGGDARSLLNALELAIETSVPWPPPVDAEIKVSFEAAEESIQRRAVLYDKEGDYHFDTISAFIKSVRGSDPDAALYWLAKMVRAGEDPSFIFRRMIILASEDVGLADPGALNVVISCAQSFDRIGFPEGNFPLAHACLYLATAPKSNSAMAFFDALAEVDREDAEVPNHLRDASRDKEGFGHGDGYIYPHAYRDHWAAQQYLPTALRGKTFYNPSRIGYEGKIRDEVLQKRELQAAVIMGDIQGAAQESPGAESAAEGEFLSWSASSKGREGWFKRLESGRSKLLLADRDAILGCCAIARHHRILVAAANDGLLLWESLRRVPEGLAAALVDSETARDALLRYASGLDEPEMPLVAVKKKPPLPSPEEAEALFDCKVFDHILAREPWRRGFGGADPEEAFTGFAVAARQLLVPGGSLVLLLSPPRLGERISRILKEDPASEGRSVDLIRSLAVAEEAFFNEAAAEGAGRWTWDRETLENSFAARSLEGSTDLDFSITVTVLEQSEERLLTEKDLSLWFDKEKSSWGSYIYKSLGEEAFSELRDMLQTRAAKGPILWKWRSLLLKGICV
ncbi:ATPase, AAA family [Treponema primitia ZAS-2]|uniref:Replication-associated recombination protein A n=1 Tax=Treponema primitia (strain ATCC BAA-887 / DSM 12427 / ZAS-2) TaxID=545694 RepID=F5YHF8_TREPZ|nr:AAA family ATPase [Treponema primitia]AEF85043.1 ATPase, AAA family [Treponema primitia ZAS-2]